MMHDMGLAQAKTVVLKNHPNKEKLKDEAILSCSPTNKAHVADKTPPKHLPPEKTVILDSGATHIA